MAVVVDRVFSIRWAKWATWRISHADIEWFIVKFEETEGGKRSRPVRDEVRYTTLERSGDGLTGGKAVPQGCLRRGFPRSYI
jgi:hypothetical protein